MHFYCEKLYLWPENGTRWGLIDHLGLKMQTQGGLKVSGGSTPPNPSPVNSHFGWSCSRQLRFKKFNPRKFCKWSWLMSVYVTNQ